MKKAILGGAPIREICEGFGIKTLTNMNEVQTHRNISGKRKLARIGIVVDMMPTIQIAKKP